MSTMIPGGSMFPPIQQPGSTPSSPASNAQPLVFSDILKNAVSQTEKLHTDAEQQVAGLLTGNGQDVHKVMIAVEKADIAFQLMMQVRNKIVNAYQEVSKMQF